MTMMIMIILIFDDIVPNHYVGIKPREAILR